MESTRKEAISCVYCGKKTMCVTYAGDYQYRAVCLSCHRQFGFSAPSRAAADLICRTLQKNSTDPLAFPNADSHFSLIA